MIVAAVIALVWALVPGLWFLTTALAPQGSIIDWIGSITAFGTVSAALATSAAVIVSLGLARRDWTHHQEKDARRQAEMLTAWLGGSDDSQGDPQNTTYLKLFIQNASEQAAYFLIAEVVGIQGSMRKTAVGDTYEQNAEMGATVGTVPPGRLETRINRAGSGGMNRRFSVEIAFQDARGRYWVRHGNGLLERVDQHPVELFNLIRPIDWGI